MMSSNLLLWGGAVLLCSMASPIVCFSHGASLTSCQEMIPGHIRAHPLDPKHSFITLHTSSSSYLPGQLITVSVRSSRDFMGFLLQARSVGGERNGFGEGPGIRTERLGPLLVGGSWIRSPPGTHTLRCLFEGDTVTHSDKQLKRNLSFVWRAPDMPKGDMRFHITVVQSYFVYWTGIESAVVCDRSPSAWRRSKTKMADGASTIVAVQETVTTQTGRHSVLITS
ncbi:reelin domain-containing protein 1 [Xiphophorus couchianus]|uniref:reelin domain-containing protein 1 n=1 Tax=Xiphophorus couchianus TaxID=32473 RepID=UPI001016956E|nr:reelin domain-containing protein 1 [Xiphophorus couchianus]